MSTTVAQSTAFSGKRQRLELSPVGPAPLRAGFVETAESRESGAFATANYVLEGAFPNGRLVVRLLVHLFDPTCSSKPVHVAWTALETDGAGKGSASMVLRPEDVPRAVRNSTHGVHWEVWRGESLVYRTTCTSVTLD